MKEGLSAFQPKINKNTENQSLENREKLPLPLQSLEKDKAEIKGFQVVLKKLLDGVVSQNDIRLFTNPRFTTVSGEEYLADANGNLKEFNGKYITKRDLGGARLLEDQIPVLESIAQERENAIVKKNSAEGQIKGFQVVLKKLLDGVVSQNDIRLFTNPRFTTVSGEEYLADANGNLKEFNGKYITKRDLGGARLLEEDSNLINTLASSLSNSSFPDEVKENLKIYVKTNDLKTLERLSTIMADANNEQMSSEVNSIVKDLVETQRVAQLKKEVYGGIVSNQPIGELQKTIAAFEGKKVSDLELASELQTAVAAKKKRDILASVTIPLQIKGRDIDKAIEEISPLFLSSRPDEREAAIEILKLAYNVELASFKNEIQKMINENVDPEMVRIYIDGLTPRPSIGDIDYVQTIVDTRTQVFKNIEEIVKVKRTESATRIRENFGKQTVNQVLESIDSFPSDTERDQAIKSQLLELYKSYVAANQPDIFDATFAEEIRKRQEQELQEKFISSEKGKNKEAFYYIRSRFVDTIYPLVESLKADKGLADKMNNFLNLKGSTDTLSVRRQFDQRLGLLEKQRNLSETERKYLQSVELLSVFNPYLVACAATDAGVTSEFLKHHFNNLSENTIENIKDGDYFPLLQIGLGPNGMAALGEIVRNNPDLASAMLVVDAGKQPGGPFAIPEGPAWELNSANSRGSMQRTLPEEPGEDELKTVRSYGSPLRWYPGERASDKTVRQGSINVTVDYLVTPDDLSTARYPTNEELALVLSLQAAVLTNNLALQTKVISIQENLDPEVKGDKLVTLEINSPSGTRRVIVSVDAIFGSTGLGESGYGFKFEGSKAEKVVEQTKNMAFPKITQTLEAFNALAGRSNEQVSPGETLVIWGKGNSADTLIEYVGSIFQGDNPKVRDITKVYIISNGDLSSRPRYALINDLKPRNGKGNLIELVDTRVSDVDFENEEGDPEKRKLVFYNATGSIIKDKEGNIIKADSAISATGFKSKLDALLEDYATDISKDEKGKLRELVRLPTNEDVAVAEVLKNDPSILILGTASKSEFENIDKLAQLPKEAREALLRNGAENAVAIGFRAPDTQAAVNIWLNTQEVSVEKKSSTSKRESLVVNNGNNVEPGETFWLDKAITAEDIKIPNNIKDEIRLLSPLFSYNVGNAIELVDSEGKRFTGELNFTMTYNLENQMLGLTFNEGQEMPVSRKIIEAVKNACMDDDFQKYALTALQKKRRNPKLDLVLSFKNGFVEPKSTFVQD